MFHSIRTVTALTLLAVVVMTLNGGQAIAVTKLKNICRVKGQEPVTLRGLGIVGGLSGTGDGGKSLATMRSLAVAMQLMGNPIGEGGAAELKDAKNVALVMVTATVPGAGAQEGERIECTISSVHAAKSLEGGVLYSTPLLGGRAESPRVYAFAEGLIRLDDPKVPTVGRIHDGCRLEETFDHKFDQDGIVTLVLDRNLADFGLAWEVSERINEELDKSRDFPGARDDVIRDDAGSDGARAVNQSTIRVPMPELYRNNPVEFVAELLEISVPDPEVDARVVINERAGSIVIGADVGIGPALITHRNVVIETGDNLPVDRFVPVDLEGPTSPSAPKLRALVEAMNAVKVPTEDIIEVIKRLDRTGKLHGNLIIE